MLKGEAPFTSHLFYTQDGILDDKISKERQLRIDAGIVWGEVAEKRVVYTDRGISKGMKYGIEAAKKQGKGIEYRNLPNYERWLKKIKKTNSRKGYEFKPTNGDFSEKNNLKPNQ